MISEMRQYGSIEPAKDPLDKIMTRDFMIYLFKVLYTYQTIGKEVLKEEIQERRVQYLRAGQFIEYEELLEGRQRDF